MRDGGITDHSRVPHLLRDVMCVKGCPLPCTQYAGHHVSP